MQIKASKVAGRIIFGEIKWQVFQLFLYFCNKIFKISVPDSRGMLYYEQSRIIKTRK
mgnify:FL=1